MLAEERLKPMKLTIALLLIISVGTEKGIATLATPAVTTPTPKPQDTASFDLYPNEFGGIVILDTDEELSQWCRLFKRNENSNNSKSLSRIKMLWNYMNQFMFSKEYKHAAAEWPESDLAQNNELQQAVKLSFTNLYDAVYAAVSIIGLAKSYDAPEEQYMNFAFLMAEIDKASAMIRLLSSNEQHGNFKLFDLPDISGHQRITDNIEALLEQRRLANEANLTGGGAPTNKKTALVLTPTPTGEFAIFWLDTYADVVKAWSDSGYIDEQGRIRIQDFEVLRDIDKNLTTFVYQDRESLSEDMYLGPTLPLVAYFSTIHHKRDYREIMGFYGLSRNSAIGQIQLIVELKMLYETYRDKGYLRQEFSKISFDDALAKVFEASAVADDLVTLQEVLHISYEIKSRISRAHNQNNSSTTEGANGPPRKPLEEFLASKKDVPRPEEVFNQGPIAYNELVTQQYLILIEGTGRSEN